MRKIVILTAGIFIFGGNTLWAQWTLSGTVSGGGGFLCAVDKVWAESKLGALSKRQYSSQAECENAIQTIRNGISSDCKNNVQINCNCVGPPPSSNSGSSSNPELQNGDKLFGEPNFNGLNLGQSFFSTHPMFEGKDFEEQWNLLYEALGQGNADILSTLYPKTGDEEYDKAYKSTPIRFSNGRGVKSEDNKNLHKREHGRVGAIGGFVVRSSFSRGNILGKGQMGQGLRDLESFSHTQKNGLKHTNEDSDWSKLGTGSENSEGSNLNINEGKIEAHRGGLRGEVSEDMKYSVNSALSRAYRESELKNAGNEYINAGNKENLDKIITELEASGQKKDAEMAINIRGAMTTYDNAKSNRDNAKKILDEYNRKPENKNTPCDECENALKTAEKALGKAKEDFENIINVK